MSYEYRDSDGDQLEVYRLAGRAPIGVVSVSGAKAHVLADEAPFVALAVLEAAGIECTSIRAQDYAEDETFTEKYLLHVVRVYLEALRIRRDRRAAEEAAKAEAAAEQQELMELAEKLYQARYNTSASLTSTASVTQREWLRIARAASQHFEGKEL